MLDKEHLSLVKTVFETFTEYAGKDILPKVIGPWKSSSNDGSSQLKILKLVYTTYKRYGLARLERIFKKVAQQIDDDLIIRNKFNRDWLSKNGIKRVAELGKTGVSFVGDYVAIDGQAQNHGWNNRRHNRMQTLMQCSKGDIPLL